MGGHGAGGGVWEVWEAFRSYIRGLESRCWECGISIVSGTSECGLGLVFGWVMLFIRYPRHEAWSANSLS